MTSKELSSQLLAMQKMVANLTDTIDDLKIENKRLSNQAKNAKVVTVKSAKDDNSKHVFYKVTHRTAKGLFLDVHKGMHENDALASFNAYVKNKNYDNLTLSEATWYGKRKCEASDWTILKTYSN